MLTGDDGVIDRNPSRKPSVDYPGSSPKVCSVAGVYDPKKDDFSSITAWNRLSDFPQPHGATGGGVSQRFPLSAGQLKLQKRLVPVHIKTGKEGKVEGDCAYLGDPYSGIKVRNNDGTTPVIGGTSAGSPGVAVICAAIQAAIARLFDWLDTMYSALAADGVIVHACDRRKQRHSAGTWIQG